MRSWSWPATAYMPRTPTVPRRSIASHRVGLAAEDKDDHQTDYEGQAARSVALALTHLRARVSTGGRHRSGA